MLGWGEQWSGRSQGGQRLHVQSLVVSQVQSSTWSLPIAAYQQSCCCARRSSHVCPRSPACTQPPAPCCAVQTFWHSSAHVLGQALELEYGADLTIGPALEEGFYYDCYLGDRTLNDVEKAVITKRMQQVGARGLSVACESRHP